MMAWQDFTFTSNLEIVIINLLSSIYTALIGSFHGHLGLVPISVQYEVLSEVPYIRLPHPQTLLISVHQLPHVVQTEQAHHKEQVCLFNKSNNIKQVLKQEIIKSIEDTYLTSLRNHQTNIIDLHILLILGYLFTNHDSSNNATRGRKGC